MELSLHNDGLTYQVRNQDGDVLFTAVESMDCIRWIREQQPHLPPDVGFAPQADERVGGR